MTEILPQEVFESREVQKGLTEFAKALAEVKPPESPEELFESMENIENVRNAMGYLMHVSFIAGRKYKGKLGKDYQ